MPISVGYVARETGHNLWRNRLMALAAILTVGVSLSLVGTALLLRQAVNNSLTALNANVDLQIFVKPGASADQASAVKSLIAQTPQIKSAKYFDHQQSYEQAVRLFESQGDNSVIPALTPATTPPTHAPISTTRNGRDSIHAPPSRPSFPMPARRSSGTGSM